MVALSPHFAFVIDWFSVTFDPYEGKRFAGKLGYMKWAADVECVPPRGYNKARKLETGAVIAWHTTRNDMGVHVQLSGSALRWYHEKSADWHTIMTWAKELGGRASRVDLAIDIFDSGLQQTDLCKPNLRAYKGKGRTPRFLPVGDQETGWTHYVGSRTSTKYLRIYDKAREQKLENGDYIRVELECKAEIARAILWEFPALSRQDCIPMAQTLIRSVADFNNDVWQAALGSVDMALTASQTRERDTLGWLVKICAPALAKQIALKPNEDVMGQFATALRGELQQRGLDIE